MGDRLIKILYRRDKTYLLYPMINPISFDLLGCFATQLTDYCLTTDLANLPATWLT